MSWFTENKFLAGFGAAMVVGVGALGYLTYSAMGKYESALGEFGTAAAELKRLQEAKPSLTDANLKELLAHKQGLGDKITSFQGQLKARVLSEEPISKEAFQNLLKDTVAAVNTRAKAANVERPKDFYMGFAEYQAKPPDAKAAPALARELRIIELVMNVLIEAGNLELTELLRTSVREDQAKPKTGDSQSAPGKKKGSDDKPRPRLVERSGLRIKFTSTDATLQKVITGLTSQKQQLFVIEKISVKNEQQAAPPRLGVAAPAPSVQPDAAAGNAGNAGAADPLTGAVAPSSPTDAASATAPVTTGLSYILGREKLVTTIDLVVLNIAAPEVKAEAAGKRREK